MTGDTDPGVHNERTALAWQRTALTLLAGSALVARLALDDLGVLAVAGFVVVLPMVGWLLWESWRRYRHQAGMRPRPRSRGGRAPAVVATVTVVVAATELAALATRV